MTHPPDKTMSGPPQNGNGSRPPIIDKTTLINVPLAAALLIGAFHVGQKMEKIEGSLRSLDETMTRTTQNALTRQEFELYKAQLRAKNPDLAIPD